jgi:hypothetical protein
LQNSQVADLESTDCVIWSAGGNDALQHIDLLEAATPTTAKDVLVRLCAIRQEFRQKYSSLLDRLAITRAAVMVLTVYIHVSMAMAWMRLTSGQPKARSQSLMT